MTSLDDKPNSTAVTQQRPLKGGYDASNLNDVMRDIDTGEINELVVVAEGEERTTWFVWILVLCSTISGLLFGAFLSIYLKL